MPTNDRTLDAQLDDRLRRLGDHLDAERHARHDMMPMEPVAVGASGSAGDPRYRWLAAAAMIVAAVAAATFITLNRGTSSGPASTGTTMAAPSSSTPLATSMMPTPTTTASSIPQTAPSETTAGPVATIPGGTEPVDTEPVDTTPSETAPSSAPTTTTAPITPSEVDLCQLPYGPVSTPCTYALVAGDTPVLVAERFGLSVDELRFANPLMADDESLGAIWIVGSGITIPIPGGEPDVPGETPRCRSFGPQQADCVYRIGVGDYPMGVVQHFGITFEALVAANPNLGSDREALASTWVVGNDVLIPAAA